MERMDQLKTRNSSAVHGLAAAPGSTGKAIPGKGTDGGANAAHGRADSSRSGEKGTGVGIGNLLRSDSGLPSDPSHFNSVIGDRWSERLAGEVREVTNKSPHVGARARVSERPVWCEARPSDHFALAGTDARRGLDVASIADRKAVAGSSAVPVIRQVQRVKIPCRNS